MITLKTMKQIATSRTIPSFRSGKSLSFLQTDSHDRMRRAAGHAQRLFHEARRQWLSQLKK
ncbi:hypothetical protein K9N68_27040 [Kovacikia minuta CCNUW1]|uniref:hypothetical protein n=1 Tax=Kovacikia minuta TaxID=2931930 RepID=UPI001CCD949F|nr:hypothetical protein [Kovacikia minuta]UBF25238.1 hypothetical protein K9N68_27040 [Kovacikia minuta CCNUW1]